nr:DUF4317 domain-containing protein [uncultured Flavonifractor sp.]
MNEKEVGELRRRFKADKCAITHVRGCYVNEKREIVSQFDQSLALMGEEESDKLLSILRRTLSGGIDRNLIDVSFATSQVAEGEEHKLLMALRDSALQDEEAVQAFFQKAIGSLDLEGSYLILLAHDRYDVPYRAKDGETQKDASQEVYSYILCSVCPVKQTKPALSFYVRENRFYNRQVDWLVSPPEVGFLFPAFDDRSTNLYDALYYNRDVGENHPDFAQAVFSSPIPMPAETQKATFQAILGETLEEECSYEVVQAVHDQLRELVEEHKENKEEEPLMVSKGAVKCVLLSCGVSESHVSAFDSRYDDSFGADTRLSPRNLVDARQVQLSMPDVTIKVSPAYSALVETRTIDGKKYVLIPAEGEVEVNGVPIHIDS